MVNHEKPGDNQQKKLDFPEYPKKINWETYLDDLAEKEREEAAIYATIHREEWEKNLAEETELQKIRSDISQTKKEDLALDREDDYRNISEETAYHQMAKQIKEDEKKRRDESKKTRTKGWWRSMAK